MKHGELITLERAIEKIIYLERVVQETQAQRDALDGVCTDLRRELVEYQQRLAASQAWPPHTHAFTLPLRTIVNTRAEETQTWIMLLGCACGIARSVDYGMVGMSPKNKPLYIPPDDDIGRFA